MRKKNKNSEQPNAPELQQILLQSPLAAQPPHNPYYFETSTPQVPPPPYSDISAPRNPPMSQIPLSDSYYSRLTNEPRQTRPMTQASMATVVVHQQPTSQHGRKVDKFNRSVRNYNYQMLFVALVAFLLSLGAYSLYSHRPCVLDFIVHQPAKDVHIRIRDVRDAHLSLAYGSAGIVLITLLMLGTGRASNHSCYLVIMGLATFLATVYTAYLTYLALWSPCSTKLSDLGTNIIKSFTGFIADSLPAPDKGVFGETNVFQVLKDGNDKEGVYIFLIDFVVFIFYLSGFFGVFTLCCMSP